MATKRTAMSPFGTVVTLETENQTIMMPDGNVVNATIEAAAPAGGDFIQSIAGYGGIAGHGGNTGRAGGIAG